MKTSPAVAFLMMMFDASVQPVYLSSLPNIKDDPTEPSERHLTTREPARIDAFMHKWDRPGRGMFNCVSTINGVKRNKDACVECGFLHADIDFKNVVEDEPTIRERLRTLRYPPSIIVRSGNGLHCYWLFKEAIDVQEHRERIEAALRQLADLVAGDLQVCEVSRLMRLPGSHNSKGHTPEHPVWTEVVMDPLNGEPRRYELSDLEEWLSETAPVIRRKVDIEETKHWPRETNPYLEHAKQYGFNPPLDVEQALGSMVFGNIHSTQISVSASLLNAGMDIEQVVETLIEATQDAAGAHSTRWNWTRERKTVRRMCESWLAKHPQPATTDEAIEQRMEAARNAPRETQASPPASGTPPASGNVVQLAARRAPKPAKKKDASAHIMVGETLLGVLTERGEAILFSDGGCYRYTEALWQLLTDPDFKAWLDREIEQAARALNFETNNRLISETRGWIMRQTSLSKDNVPWDRHRQIPTLAGLVNPHTGALTLAEAEHYCTWRVPYVYAANAQCPMWLQMLDDAFSDRAQDVRVATIELLQELLGLGLIDDKAKALSQALVVEGGPDTGKSGLIEVMGGMYGIEHNTTTFEMIGTTHGLMQFVRRAPWVLHEAFDQSKWHLSAIVKSIISGDPIQINVKYGPQLSRRFTAPIYWATNHPPQFKEATAAITNRTVVVRCRRQFDRDRPIGAAMAAQRQGFSRPGDLVLSTEPEGLLAWAVAGLRRALTRGSLKLPQETIDTAHAIRRDSNLVLGFVEECTRFDPWGMVSVSDFAVAFASWWAESRGDDRNAPGSESIGKALRALGDPRIAIDATLRDKARRYIAGVSLDEEGMRHWHNGVTANSFQFASRRASTTDASGDPNMQVPPIWSERTVIATMRKAQGVTVTEGGIGSPSPEGASAEGIEQTSKPRF